MVFWKKKKEQEEETGAEQLEPKVSESGGVRKRYSIEVKLLGAKG